MNTQIQEQPNHQLNVNQKTAYTDMDGCVRMQVPFNDDEKQAVAKHLKTNNSKFKYMRPRRENIVAAELIRYYQQKDALVAQKETYNNPEGYANLMTFYNDKIITLSKELDEINPERLQTIERQRANDCTVNGAETI